ncbi:ECF transporter S component [Ruminiclostridium cellobioparum]|jgi:uncharacterized membrane protein|uniref:ECF transporter S component n=1 Tax=Ruminiclostridium cellobioparum TaxID=29355 RepID=UPI0028AF5D65|nr:ECF transporter S component [Ruminiclostridium cellobioparum]
MKISTRKIVLTAMMIALVFIITYLPFLHIPSPVPPGYFNIGDAAIMVAAILLGRKSGLAAGAIGAALADLAYGAFIFVPITFIVKGIEGYVVGAIAHKKADQGPDYIRRIIAVAAGAIIIVAGYFILELTFYRMIDDSLAVAAIISEVPGNLVQGGVSAVIAYIFIAILDKTNVMKKLN